MFGIFSTSQFIALIIVPVAVFMLYWLGRPVQSAGATATAAHARVPGQLTCRTSSSKCRTTGRQRLDRFLAARPAGALALAIQRLIKDGQVLVGGRHEAQGRIIR